MIRSVFTIALAAVVGGLLALAAAIAARQALHQAAERRQKRLDLVIRPMLFEALDSGRFPEAASLHSSQRRALTQLAVAMLTKVRGDDRIALVRVLDDSGVLAAAVRGLESRRAIVRARSAELLGSARLGAAVPRITALLTDRRPDVRIVAARAIGKLGDPAAVAALLASVDEPLRLPEGLVAMALVRLGEPGALGLRDGLLHESPRVRSLAAEVLGQVGDLGAADALLSTLASDPDSDVRVQAAGALGRLGLPRTILQLITCLQSAGSPDLQAAAARALGLIGSAAAADALTSAAGALDHRVARQAARALAVVAPDRLALLVEHDTSGFALEAIALEDIAASQRGFGPRWGTAAA